MDGFDQDHAASECDDCIVALIGFLAPERHAFEALQLAHGLLDAGARLVERFGKEGGPVFGIESMQTCGGDYAAVAVTSSSFAGRKPG